MDRRLQICEHPEQLQKLQWQCKCMCVACVLLCKTRDDPWLSWLFTDVAKHVDTNACFCLHPETLKRYANAWLQVDYLCGLPNVEMEAPANCNVVFVV